MDGEAGQKWATPPGKTLDGRRRGGAGSEVSYNTISDSASVLEWSLSKVGTSPPHDL